MYLNIEQYFYKYLLYLFISFLLYANIFIFMIFLKKNSKNMFICIPVSEGRNSLFIQSAFQVYCKP